MNMKLLLMSTAPTDQLYLLTLKAPVYKLKVAPINKAPH